MSARALPEPPYALATRVGALEGHEDPWGFYDALGAAHHAAVLDALPDDLELDGRRILDFGCGAGRTLRHFLAAGGAAELWGCDLDAPSVAWIEANLGAVEAFVSGEDPPLPQPDGFFDVVYCVSVFTHLTNWSAWLLELHRVLRPGGILVATFMGEGQSQAIAGEPWDSERVGMLVLQAGQPWDAGGPMVLHSPWWVREHWGRAFEVVRLKESGFDGPAGTGHGVVTLRRRDVHVDAAALERLADDPREALALQHAAELQLAEIAAVRRDRDMLYAEVGRLSAEVAELRRQIDSAPPEPSPRPPGRLRRALRR